MNADSSRLRLAVIGVVAISLFAALFARLWFLQVLAAPEYRLAAESNQVRIVPEPAPRGRILDRNGRVLVDNRVSRVVTVDKSRLSTDDRPALLARLAVLLDVPADKLADRLDDPRRSQVIPVPVATEVTEAAIIAIQERPDLFDPSVVRAEQVAVRSYPYGPLAAHLLGYVAEINGSELEARKSQGYRLGDEIGKTGVERVYELDLRGKVGLEKLEVDRRGRVLGTLGSQDPVPGNDIRLTIDLDLQLAAERALAEGLAATRRRVDPETKRKFVAPAGSVVVLDPRDGSVLASASNPTYDPSEFVGGISVDRYAALTADGSGFPLSNRVIHGEYAPASTFKLVTAAAGLSGGLIKPNTTVLDQGSLRIGDRSFRNAGSRAYGRIAVSRALTVSSDVFFYALGRDFWEQRSTYGDGIQATARSFGFGEVTGIPLESELDGRVPDPDVKAQLHEANPRVWPEARWFTGDSVNLSIGQGLMAVTPIQLANAYAVFANGGIRYEPRLLEQVERPDGTVLRTAPVTERGRIEMDSTIRDAILAGLEGVVSSAEGTAAWAFSGFDQRAWRVAGKTGTAQVTRKHDTALFAAFAPSRAPELVVAVVMEESGFGSTAAAPVARRILDVASGQAPRPTEGTTDAINAILNPDATVVVEPVPAGVSD